MPVLCGNPEASAIFHSRKREEMMKNQEKQTLAPINLMIEVVASRIYDNQNMDEEIEKIIVDDSLSNNQKNISIRNHCVSQIKISLWDFKKELEAKFEEDK